MFSKILVCLDGSKLAEQILPYATEQAKRFNSKIVLLQVFSISNTIAAVSAGSTAAPVASEELIRDEVQRQESEALKYLEGVAAKLREAGLDVTAVARQGIPGEIIVDYAHQENIDLITLATHDHSGLGRIVLGSVADNVLRQSGLPILLIKPQNL
jgi:nucleotide-binding universal stress UspA family protein